MSERIGIASRLEDVADKAARGEVAVLPFLTPRERVEAERALRQRGLAGQMWFFGGYPTAERVCLFLLPDYFSAMLPTVPMEAEIDTVKELLAEDVDRAVCALSVKGSKYRELTHRDYLGAILRTGLERDAIGDIAVQNEHEAILFCSRTVAGFLCENLKRVANDAVKCCICRIGEGFTDGRHYQPINETVASPRLDCVVAALTDLSRERAQELIRTGLVEVDFEPVERTDLMLSPSVTLSVRGYGRYILRDFPGETRKGRLRLSADKIV